MVNKFDCHCYFVEYLIVVARYQREPLVSVRVEVRLFAPLLPSVRRPIDFLVLIVSNSQPGRKVNVYMSTTHNRHHYSTLQKLHAYL